MAKKTETDNNKNTTKNEEIKKEVKVSKKETKAEGVKKTARKESTTGKTTKKVTTSKEKVNNDTKNKKTKREQETKENKEKQIIPKEKDIKLEEIKKTIKNKKELPKEEKLKINKKLFRNIIIAIIITAYFIFLNLGKMNIENSVYVTDLKVFSMCTLLTAIILIEVAYKRECGEIAIHGIEMIILSIMTMALIYVNLMLSTQYVYIVTAVSLIFAGYYLIKSIVIYLKNKKQYFVNNMKEIMNKDE